MESAKQNDRKRFFLVRERSVPEVLLKVAEVNELLVRTPSLTVQEAVGRVGLSRSSYYRYKDDISPLHESSRGKTMTFMIKLEDKPGYLTQVLKIISTHNGNILTIHQSIPIHGVALLTTSVRLSNDSDVDEMFREIEQLESVYEIRLLGEESSKEH